MTRAKEWVNEQLITNNGRIDKLTGMAKELNENLMKMDNEIKALEKENRDHKADICKLEGKQGVDF